MRNTTFNFIVDAVSLLIILAMVYTGLLIKFVMPPGTNHSHLLWGLGRHGWGDVHFWLAVWLGVVLIIHVTLHWAWVCQMVSHLLSRFKPLARAGRGKRTVYGIVFCIVLIALIGSSLWFASSQVDRTDDGDDHQQRRQFRGGRGGW